MNAKIPLVLGVLAALGAPLAASAQGWGGAEAPYARHEARAYQPYGYDGDAYRGEVRRYAAPEAYRPYAAYRGYDLERRYDDAYAWRHHDADRYDRYERRRDAW